MPAKRWRAIGDSSAAEYRLSFESGKKWIDASLFNGEFFIQKVRGFQAHDIAPNRRSNMGSDETEKPVYQAGEECLAEQLLANA